MSDDEVLRRRLPFVAVAAGLALLGGALWLRSQMLDDVTAFKAFCSATHPGETWAHVQERARGKGYDVRHEGRERDPTWLVHAELWGYRAGCVVTLEKERVVNTRFAELP